MASLDVRSLALTVPAVIFLVHFVPWLVDPCGIRRYPGPFLAKFSDLWLAYVGKSGQLSETIRKIHEKYGMPFRHVCFQLTGITNRLHRPHRSQSHLHRRSGSLEYRLRL